MVAKQAQTLTQASQGNELDALVALRDVLARKIDEVDSARDLAALSRQYDRTLERIEAAKKRHVQTTVGGKRTPRDEVAARRAERERRRAASE